MQRRACAAGPRHTHLGTFQKKRRKVRVSQHFRSFFVVFLTISITILLAQIETSVSGARQIETIVGAEVEAVNPEARV